jgi:S1-C subfamily serine protease
VRRPLVLAACLLAVLACVVLARAQSEPADSPGSATPPPAPPSAAAQRIYASARSQLLQVRTLLKNQDSQSSVGSGFLASAEGHLVTNYHVISDVALEPDRYRLVYRTAEGKEGTLELLGFDVVHDVAVLRPTDRAAFSGLAPLPFRPRTQALQHGERIYSLGNPLDVGFAVVEGTYNGEVERSFYPTIFFAGSLNPGVSGGPTLDERGQVIGINVASRRDGEQVSFLVPSSVAEDLLDRARVAKPSAASAYPEVARQLLGHQAALTTRFLADPWQSAGHARYRIPVPRERFMRCWGRNTGADTKGLQFEHAECNMDSGVFVSDRLITGWIGVRHETYDGRTLGTLRFADRYSDSFQNESFGRRSTTRTGPQCHERYVRVRGLPLRAVICMSAYKKLPELYDIGVLVATVDQSQGGAQGRFDAYGVSFDNGMRLALHYLEGYGWTAPQASTSR